LQAKAEKLAKAEAMKREEERKKLKEEQLKLEEEELEVREKKIKLAKERVKLAEERLKTPEIQVKQEGVKKRTFEAIDCTGDGDYEIPSRQIGEVIVIDDD